MNKSQKNILLAGYIVAVVAGCGYWVWQSGMLQSALPQETLEERAAKGDVEAYYELGKQYNFAGDYQKSCDYYEKAAGTAHYKALNNLALCYSEGKGRVQDLDRAISLYKRSIEQGGGALPIANLASLYYEDKKDYEKAFSWYQKAAEMGDRQSLMRLGYMYYTGRGVEKDMNKAVDFYKKAGEAGFASAFHVLGDLYERGDVGGEDYAGSLIEAGRLYKNAIDRGNADARKRLKETKEQCGLVSEKDEPQRPTQEGAKVCLIAAGAGDAAAQFYVGEMYRQGAMVKQDVPEGMRWLRLSAEQGYVRAQVRLVQAYGEGKGVPRDDIEAYAWSYVLSKQENPETEQEKRIIETVRKGLSVLLKDFSPEEKNTAEDVAQGYYKRYGNR